MAAADKYQQFSLAPDISPHELARMVRETRLWSLHLSFVEAEVRDFHAMENPDWWTTPLPISTVVRGPHGFPPWSPCVTIVIARTYRPPSVEVIPKSWSLFTDVSFLGVLSCFRLVLALYGSGPISLLNPPISSVPGAPLLDSSSWRPCVHSLSVLQHWTLFFNGSSTFCLGFSTKLHRSMQEPRPALYPAPVTPGFPRFPS